jgi:hypothetical protein
VQILEHKKREEKKETKVRTFGSRKVFGAWLALAAIGFCGTAAAQEAQVLVNIGNTDGKLGALSRRPSVNKAETETADDFVLRQTTVVTGATIVGLISPATPLANVANVEVELYHVFPEDSINPPSGHVPTRQFSPGDVEIDSATRDGISRTLSFSTSLLNPNFSAPNSVSTGINKVPLSTTHGDGPVTGEEVQIAVTFAKPIVLPAGHYYFRPEVSVNGGDFFYLSAPKPIVAPGIAIAGDLQAWIRNTNLSPDWLRIGGDIIGVNPAPAFNMTFSLSGVSLVSAGVPGQDDCHDVTLAGLADQFGSASAAASALGFPSVKAMQDAFRTFCGN